MRDVRLLPALADAMTKNTSVTPTTYRTIVAAENSNPPRDRSNPMSVRNCVSSSAGSDPIALSSASDAIPSLNRAAMWLAGTSVPIVCIAEGMVPMGM